MKNFTYKDHYNEITIENGKLVSNLKRGADLKDDSEFCSAIDGMESLLLALHCAGVDLNTNATREAIQITIETICNKF